MRRRFEVLAGYAAMLLSAVAALPAATPPEAVNEKPIELPKFEVVDSRVLPLPESWHYAELPGFEILSNISAGQTKRFANDFLLLQEVIQIIMPTLTSGRTDVPTALLLCGRGNGFDEFLPADQADQEFSKNSLFFENTERTAIVVDFALPELQLDPDTRIEADPYRSFYREYFRFLIRRRLGQHPSAWLEEGLVQLFAGIDFNNKWIDFGLIGDGFGGNKPGDFNVLLANHYLIPLDRVFAEDSKSADAYWSAECYAFVHMCLYGMNKKYQKPFIEFVSRLDREGLSEDLFKQCFHENYKDMALDLRGYLQFTQHTYVQYKAKKGQKLPEPPSVNVRDATQSEVGRIKGEVLRLGGHDEQAHLALIAPYIRGEKDPRLLAALGLDEANQGHDERAMKFLEVATREKVTRARAYLELAKLRYKAVLAQAGAKGQIDATQLASVLDPLFQARRQPPPLPEVYLTIADAWSHSAVAPTREQFAVVVEGVRIFPTNADLLMAAVQLAAKSGFNDDARKLADFGVKVFANNPAARDRFELLAAAMQRDTGDAVVAPTTENAGKQKR